MRSKFLGKDDDGQEEGEGVEGGVGEDGGVGETTNEGGATNEGEATDEGEAKTATGGTTGGTTGGRMPWEEEDGVRVVWEESGGGGRGNPFVRNDILFPAIPRRSEAWVKMETFSSSRKRVKRRRHARDMKTRKHGILIRRHTSKRRPKSNPSDVG